jgi:two-component system, chemotaxis family, response regulator Rcp1
MTAHDAIDILLVEDSAGDIRLTQEALKEGGLPHRLHVVRDGVDALSFLRREDDFGAAPRPGIVLLDLNLPRLDGHQVLRTMKGDEHLRRLPVIVLSTSAADDDVVRAYDQHAACYIVKPTDFGRFMDVVKTIEDFWLSVVRLPDSHAYT